MIDVRRTGCDTLLYFHGKGFKGRSESSDTNDMTGLTRARILNFTLFHVHVKVRGKTIQLKIDFPIVVQMIESSDIFHKHHGIESPLLRIRFYTTFRKDATAKYPLGGTIRW